MLQLNEGKRDQAISSSSGLHVQELSANLSEPVKTPMKTGLRASTHRLWEGWKRVARKIGDFQARLMLTLFYILVVGPFALLIRWRSDPLNIKKTEEPRGWQEHKERPGEPLERASQQF